MSPRDKKVNVPEVLLPNATVEPTVEPKPKRFPKISVLERRLASPFGEPSRSIELRDQDEPMVLRWVSEDSRPGRMDIARNIQGWEPVTKDELADPEAIQGLAVAPDGTVRRGERMRAHLMKMPKAMYDKIQMAKTETLMRRQRSSSATKAEIASKTAEKFGPQAGDYIDSVILNKGEIIESVERVER